MTFRSRSFFIHKANVQRPVLAVDTSYTRDRKVQTFTDVLYNQACWFEHIGVTLIDSDQFGRVPVERYNVYFEGDVDVRVNDRLTKASEYFLVESVVSTGDEDFHKLAIVRKQSYSMI